ncbi:MAG TPA: glycoside hydrolase family 16 protein [Terriglobia bacterium]|nr:glycoside hydrolase family 16 protein [Terriglobia bacterium]
MLRKRIDPLAAVAGAVMLAALLLAGGDLAQAAPPQRQNRAPNRGGGGFKAWVEDFSSNQLNTRFWVIASGRAPGYYPDQHIGYYEPSHVKTQSGMLSMLLTQEIGPVGSKSNGTISHGALIYTRKKYGYGTYEWTMRMSSTAATPDGTGAPTSGSVSAGFIYVNNSETEIDFEFSARPEDIESLYMVNWNNTDPSTDPTGDDEYFSTLDLTDIGDVFHTYKFVWEPGQITFYVDGVQRGFHTDHVPSAPAYFMINHWGTDGPWWGGYATIGIDRYFYIDRVSYTPLP